MLRPLLAMTLLTLLTEGCNTNHRYQESYRNYELGLAPPEHTTPVRLEEAPPAEDLELLEQGGTLYAQNCIACHGVTGNGEGIVTKKAAALKESLLTPDVLRKTRAEIYEVITNGQEKMLPFKAKLLPNERWALSSYVKALQLSRNFPVKSLDPKDREKLP